MLLDEIVSVRQDALKTQQKRKEKKETPKPTPDLSEPEDDLNFESNYDVGESPEIELKEFMRQWEREFDYINMNPEDNSDFDSDNDINPLDTLNSLGQYSTKTQQITSDNLMKRKPIQFSIVGKPNTGKSTLVNTLLNEQRVIANDLEGTTRDAVRISWIYAGRRITLVDTAGIKMGKRNDTVVDAKVQ